MNTQVALSSSPTVDIQYLCRTLTQASLIPIAVVDGSDHIVRYANPAFCLLTGTAKEQLIGSVVPCIIEGDECRLMLDRVYRTGKAETHRGQEVSTEHDFYRSCSMSPVLDASDHSLGIFIQVIEASSTREDTIAMNEALLLGSLRQQELIGTADSLNLRLQAEIAVSKQTQEVLRENELHIETALKEKEILLGEIHHRVKNNLQIVHSLLDLQASQIQDPSVVAMLRDSQHRIRSMGLIHQTLYQSNDFARVDFGMFLNSLVPMLIASYVDNPERINLSIHAEDMHLPINVAIPCGLLVNELISNCLKHAFPKGRPGKIDIVFVHEPDGGVMLSVSDDGVGIPEDLDMAQTVSLGLQLTFLLTDQLHGKMTVHRSDPTSFGLRFSAEDLADLPATE